MFDGQGRCAQFARIRAVPRRPLRKLGTLRFTVFYRLRVESFVQPRCLIHGYRFDPSTGDCLTVGGYGLPVFAVDVDGDTVFVSVWEYD